MKQEEKSFCLEFTESQIRLLKSCILLSDKVKDMEGKAALLKYINETGIK